MAVEATSGHALLRSPMLEKLAPKITGEIHDEEQDAEEWHFVGNTRIRPSHLAYDEPLVDRTEKMTLRSKRTERLQRKMQKKEGKKLRSEIRSFLDLPSELLMEVLTYFRPSDLFSLSRVSRSAKEYIERNEHTLCEEIVDMRYPILAKCFPSPVLFGDVDESVHPVLLAPRHQHRLIIHKAPYSHISTADPKNTCSCMACVLAWNNMCLIVDLAHWQKKLDDREPIPMLGRGTRSAWNTDLIRANAVVVNKAIRRPLWRARVFERHLNTTIRTVVRSAAIRKKKEPPETDVHPSRRLYHLSKEDIALETDTFLQRSGKPSFEFPFTRDNYYALVTYVPNRRWDENKWLYYGDLQGHEKDLAWAKMVYDREIRLSFPALVESKAEEVISTARAVG